MAVVVTSVDRATVFADGGYLIVLTGTFPLDTKLRVYIGTAGNTTDPQCVSGKAGQGKDVYALTTTTLRAYTPVMPAGGPYKIFVVAPDLGENGTLNAAITAVAPDFKSSVFSMRSVMPPRYATGPRTIDAVEPIP